MKVSFQNLIQELFAVFFEKDELEFREMSELKSHLSPLAYQDSNSDVDIIIWEAQKRTICFRHKHIDWDTLIEKNEGGRLEEVRVRIPSFVKTKSVFWQPWSIKIP